jgi:hypothetical protein
MVVIRFVTGYPPLDISRLRSNDPLEMAKISEYGIHALHPWIEAIYHHISHFVINEETPTGEILSYDNRSLSWRSQRVRGWPRKDGDQAGEDHDDPHD